jgi:O-antigen ligase
MITVIKNFRYLIFTIIYFSILITGERASSILSTLLILFLLFFNLKDLDKKKLKIYGSLFLFIFIVLLNLNNSNIKERFFYTFEQSKNNIYIDLYSNSINIFKKNKVIGTGLQTYRLECSKFSKKCSTHPHNFLLELLSDYRNICYYFIFGIINLSDLFQNQKNS